MTGSGSESKGQRPYRCSEKARWLPRVLAGAILAAGLLVSLRVDPHSTVPGSRAFRVALVVAAAVAALWVVQRGGELRVEIEVGPDGLLFSERSRRWGLRFDDIEALGYEAPFAATRSWLPAALITDRQGKSWRLSALLEDGDGLIDGLVQQAGREDLGAWADALRLRQRMAGGARRVAVGYASAAAVLILGTMYYLH